MITEAVILAGGLGTRLRSAVPDLPKCMAPVAGRPFLSYLTASLRRQGVQRLIFSLGYKHEVVSTFLEKEAASLHHSSSGNGRKDNITYLYSIEETPLGTGGAIRKASGMADSENILVLNGDTFFKADLHKLAGLHLQRQADCSLCLKPMAGSDRYGVVELNEESRITAFREKKWYAKSLINGGVYALNLPSFLAAGLPEKCSFEKDYLEAFCHRQNFYGLVQDAYFIDIGIPEDYQKAETELPKNI